MAVRALRAQESLRAPLYMGVTLMIVIDEPNPGELERLLEIFQAARRSANCYPETSIDRMGFTNLIAGEDIYAARSSDVIIAFAGVYAPGGFIHHLYVDPACQQQGVGSKLLRYCRAKIGPQATLKCDLCNTRAVQFYRRLGANESQIGTGDFGPWVEFQLGGIA